MAVSLKNQVVCITGAARGIGKETARLLAEMGAEVWIGDIDLKEAELTAKELGKNVHAQHLDVTNPDSFQAFVDAPKRPIRMLVNNAGIMNNGKFHEIPLDAHLREIGIDLSGVIIGMRLVLPNMLKHNQGHIVNVASMAGKFTLPGVATYNATKFGVVALSRSVRSEIIDSDVSITTILPSAVNTDLLSGISTKWVPTYSPRDIAKEIVDSLTHQQPEVMIPRWASATGLAEQLLPEFLFDGLKRLIGGDRLMKQGDLKLRENYLKRNKQIEKVKS